MYKALFSTAYFGLFRISELTYTQSYHVILVNDVFVGVNKKKMLFVLRSLKTQGKGSRPQQIKISAKPHPQEKKKEKVQYCSFHLLDAYISIRPRFRSTHEIFFIFHDFTPVTDQLARTVLRAVLKAGGFTGSAYGTSSFRAGRVTDLLELGVSVETIKKLGRWTSKAVYNYLH